MSPPLNNTADPVERTSSPYPNPYEIGPKSKILSSRTSNYHSTSLRNMVTVNTVNKTALHPGGVQPVKEHTELEEELHEKAHIDYDRVAIVPNPSVAALYEDALVYETGSAITSTGALTAYSGAKTGRSPLDKRIVKEPGSENEIWWGPVNKPMTPDVRLHSLSFTIPWSCTGLSLKSHDCCRSFCEIAIAFQTNWPSNFMILYTIDSTQCTNSFLFPIALFTIHE
jgi:hypothetical protein